MFGKVQFPLPTVEKVAIEYHLDWLFRRFGIEPIQRLPTLTPDSDELQPFFADSSIARKGLLDFIASQYPFDCDGCEIAVWDGHAAPPLEPDLVLLSPEEHEHPVAMVNRMATHLAFGELALTNVFKMLEGHLRGLFGIRWRRHVAK